MNKKLRITFLVPDFSNHSIQDSGGASKSIYLIIKTLCTMGYPVKVISIGKNNFSGIKKIGDIDVFVKEIKKSIFDPPISHLILPKILNALISLENETDIFHFYNVNYDYASFYYKMISRNKKKIVSTLNNYSSICPNYSCMYNNEVNHIFNLKQRVENLMEEYGKGIIKNLCLTTYAIFFPILYTKPSKSCDGYIALRKKIKNIYSSNNFKNISIIPNIYEKEKSTDIKNIREKTILFVGRIKKSKGLEFLIESFLKCKQNNYKLVVVGDGAELKNIKNKFSKVKQIVFKGKIPYSDISAYYKKAEIFVHPGQWPEPFARTIIEAIQNGCKILISDISAPEILVKNKINIFNYKDQVELTKKLEAFMNKDLGYIPKKELLQLKSDLIVNKIIKKYLSLI